MRERERERDRDRDVLRECVRVSDTAITDDRPEDLKRERKRVEKRSLFKIKSIQFLLR